MSDDPRVLPGRVEPLRYMAMADFKAMAKTGAAPGNVILTKDRELDDVRKAADGLRVVISTADQDRSRDTIAPGGWELRNFNRNPVVLFCHDYWSLPVAKAPRTFVEGAQLVSFPEFTPPDLYPFGDMVGRMVGAGFLGASSVGFRPLKWAFNEQTGGIDFSEQELLEWSFVPVPDNPMALVEGKAILADSFGKAAAAGYDMGPMVAWVKHSAAFLATSGLVEGEGEREALLKIADRGRVSVEVKEPAPAPAGESFVPQVLVFPKAHWKAAEDVRAWARERGHVDAWLGESEEAFTLRQRSRDDFETVRSIALDPPGDDPAAEGCRVAAVGGPLKAAAPDVVVEKAGRVLSKRNESALKSALESIEAAVGRVKEVLDQVAAAAEEEDEDDMPAHDPECANDGCEHPDHGKGKAAEPPPAPAAPQGITLASLAAVLGHREKGQAEALREQVAALLPAALKELVAEDEAKRSGRLPG